MQKQFCRKPQRKKELVVKEIQVEFVHSEVDSNFMECYICFGPHVARKYPKVVALDMEEEGDGDSPNYPDSLYFIGAFRTMKDSALMPLLYIHVVVNGREINAMVDTGATHNMVSNVVVARLKLNIEKHISHVKAINSKVQPVAGIVRGATIVLGGWKGKIDLLTMRLDDFNLVLDIDFLTTAKAAVMLHLGGMLLMEEARPFFVNHFQKEKKEKEALFLARQVEQGLKKKDPPWRLAKEEQTALHKLKAAIATKLVLRFLDFEAPFEVHANASNRVVDRVLVQEGHPIAFER